MFTDSIHYIYRKLGYKLGYFLSRLTETYDPSTGIVTTVEKSFPIKALFLSINVETLPSNCVSTDTAMSVLTTEIIDTSDKIKSPDGTLFTIKHLIRTSFDPIIYEVIIHAN